MLVVSCVFVCVFVWISMQVGCSCPGVLLLQLRVAIAVLAWSAHTYTYRILSPALRRRHRTDARGNQVTSQVRRQLTELKSSIDGLEDQIEQAARQYHMYVPFLCLSPLLRCQYVAGCWPTSVSLELLTKVCQSCHAHKFIESTLVSLCSSKHVRFSLLCNSRQASFGIIVTPVARDVLAFAPLCNSVCNHVHPCAVPTRSSCADRTSSRRSREGMWARCGGEPATLCARAYAWSLVLYV